MERAIHLLLISMMIVIFLAPQKSSSSSKKGCPDRCRSMSISYPFGIGAGCSKEPAYEVICNTSTNPPRASLQVAHMTFDVIDIYATSIHVRQYSYEYSVNRPTVDGRKFSILAWSLDESPYWFPDGNWITVISCDDAADILGMYIDSKIYNGGCISLCRTKNDSGGILSCLDKDNSIGIGCCRTPIPRGTSNVLVKLFDIHTTREGQNGRLFSNGYAFIGEKMKSFNKSFLLTELDNNATTFISEEWLIDNAPRVLLDWRIGAQTCSEAQINTSYACQANTYCVDVQNAVGYLCNCSKGYVGNPYLAPGCHGVDVDECADSRTNPCDSNALCTNTLGGYTCSCRKGYSDIGNGCIRNPEPKAITIMKDLGIAVGVIGGLMLLVVICYFSWRKMQERRRMKNMEKKFLDLLPNPTDTKHFTMKELLRATDNFNEGRVLREGSQGTVYKGMMSNGTVVAVKKLNRVDENDVDRLTNEIAILSTINHRNVVKLLGCCLQTQTLMIVYEFVINGSLSDHLHVHNTQLTWNTHLKMAIDIANAINHLHTGCEKIIYYRDIKSSNILLDKNFNVKVSDFGVSKVLALDQTHTIITTAYAGTNGYIDPQSVLSHRLNDKSDAFSFGVVLAELVSRKKPTFWEGGNEISLSSIFKESIAAGAFDTIVDAQVSTEAQMDDIIHVARIAGQCLSSEGRMRPTMKEVVVELRKMVASSSTSTAAAHHRPSTSTESGELLIDDSDDPYSELPDDFRFFYREAIFSCTCILENMCLKFML